MINNFNFGPLLKNNHRFFIQYLYVCLLKIHGKDNLSLFDGEKSPKNQVL